MILAKGSVFDNLDCFERKVSLGCGKEIVVLLTGSVITMQLLQYL